MNIGSVDLVVDAGSEEELTQLEIDLVGHFIDEVVVKVALESDVYKIVSCGRSI